MSVSKAVNLLKEAARYTRVAPAASERLIDEALDEIESPENSMFGWRLHDNLMAAQKWILVEPDLAAGYCNGAAFELQATKGGE